MDQQRIEQKKKRNRKGKSEGEKDEGGKVKLRERWSKGRRE